MSENLIIRHCAPTLAGIKTGNLFNASYDSIEQLDDEIRRMNIRLRGKGLRIVRLRARDNRAWSIGSYLVSHVTEKRR